MYLLDGGMFTSEPKLVVQYNLCGLYDGLYSGYEEFLEYFGEDWE